MKPEIRNKFNKPSKKIYTFTDYVVTDDKNWKTERRIQWKKESDASNQAIIAKYGVKRVIKPPLE